MARQSFNRPPDNTPEDRARQQKEVREHRRALAKKMQSMARDDSAALEARSEQVQPPRTQRDADAYLAALGSMPLRRLGSRTPGRLAPWYQAAVPFVVDAMNNGIAEAMLFWPVSQTCPSGLANLLTIAAVSSAKPIRIDLGDATDLSREQGDEFRAVLFPYARSTHTAARQVQVDGALFGSINFDHFKRRLSTDGHFSDEKAGTKDYHQVMAQVRQLSKQSGDKDQYSEFEHPILDEIVPHGPPKGEKRANSELLWRSKSKTDIKKHSRSGAADDPSSATYYVYTISAEDELRFQLRAVDPRPDLVVMDLSRAGRGRLGLDWKARARNAVKQIQEIHAGTGIIAFTEDPWVYNFVRFDLLGSRKHRKSKKMSPAPGRIAFSWENSIVVDVNQSTREFEGANEISVNGFHGAVDRSIEQLRKFARDLQERGSPQEAATARQLIGIVRRTASLPGSLAALSQFLEAETTTSVAADYISAFRASDCLAALSDAKSLASQLDTKWRASVGVGELMCSLEDATPMSSLLNDAIQDNLGSSSRSIIVFRSDMIADFAASELEKRNRKIARRIEKDMLRCGGAHIVATVSSARSATRNQFKRLILVAPTRSTILEMLAEAWLPDHVMILADSDTLLYAAKDAERLAHELEQEPIARRLRDFAARANARVAEIGRHNVRFDDHEHTLDVEFPVERVIDLGGGGRDARSSIEIVLQNGQRILAGPSSKIVVRNDSVAENGFAEKMAGAIGEGEDVCVIGSAFMDRARSLVNFRAKAATEIREYHVQVAERFRRLPGLSISERLRHLANEMGEPKVSPYTARYWVKLDQEFEKEVEEVVPHAPHDRETFLRFTKVLGIGGVLADNFWRWAVVAQRSHKTRAGNVFHEAFRGILTDPHSALAQNVDRTEEIYALRAIAEEHVATVVEVREVEAG